jgi:hypothetical protein
MKFSIPVCCMATKLLYCFHKICIQGCIQKFLDWLPGARTANGTALSLGAVILLLCESV